MRIEADDVIRAIDIERYIGQYVPLRPSGKERVGNCPFHEDKSPSFTVTPETRLFYCFGCQAGGNVINFVERWDRVAFPEALAKLADIAGLTGGSRKALLPQLPPPPEPEAGANTGPRKLVKIYVYHDAAGDPLFEVCRFEPGRDGKKKDFQQRYTDRETSEVVYRKFPDPVLYRLPSVIGAGEVLYVEGEKDAETVEALGYVGTTAPGGSNAAFTPAMVASLAGKVVFIVPDNDEPGEKRARQVAAALKGKAEVVFFHVATGKDITDWVEAEGEDAVRQAIEEARENATRERLKGLLDVGQVLQRSGLSLDQFCDMRRRPKGVLTGFKRLDDMTLGMFPGDLVIVAGRPAMGKTSLAINIALNVASDGLPVCVFSLEMSSEQLLTRMACSEARVGGQKFRLGFTSVGERREISRQLNRIAQLPLLIDDHPGASIKYIREQIKGKAPRLIVVDYLGLMGAPKSENRVQQVSAITRETKLLAKEYKLPILMVAQLSRSTETRVSGGNIPQLSDLRESGSIEQDADHVWFVYRPEYYKPDREELRGIAEIIVAKQRNGPVGKATLGWIGEYTKFVNRTQDEEPGGGI